MGNKKGIVLECICLHLGSGLLLGHASLPQDNQTVMLVVFPLRPIIYCIPYLVFHLWYVFFFPASYLTFFFFPFPPTASPSLPSLLFHLFHSKIYRWSYDEFLCSARVWNFPWQWLGQIRCLSLPPTTSFPLSLSLSVYYLLLLSIYTL